MYLFGSPSVNEGHDFLLHSGLCQCPSLIAKTCDEICVAEGFACYENGKVRILQRTPITKNSELSSCVNFSCRVFASKLTA